MTSNLDDEEAARILLDLKQLESTEDAVSADCVQVSEPAIDSLESFDNTVEGGGNFELGDTQTLEISYDQGNFYILTKSNTENNQDAGDAGFSNDTANQGDVAYLNNKKQKTREDTVKAAKKLSKFQHENAFLRLHGQAYKGVKKVNGKVEEIVNRAAKEIGAGCDSTSRCQKENSSFGCKSLLETERLRINQMFWALETWNDKKDMLKTLVEEDHTARPKPESDNPRKSSFRYFLLDSNGKRVRVCASLFSATLGQSQATILRWLRGKKEREIQDSEQQEEHEPPPKRRKLEAARVEGAREFLRSLPKVEAHYVRREDSRLYLEPNWESDREFYRFYQGQSESPVGRTTLIKLMNEGKLSIHQWKKDLCSDCEELKKSNKNPKHSDHWAEKVKAIDLKNKMKVLYRHESDTFMFSVDAEAALPVPKLNVDAYYYRTKMMLHNLTFYNMQNKNVVCYVFGEKDASCKSDVFASCYEDYIQIALKENNAIRKIIIWSDNCGYQNKNSTLGNVLLKVAMVNSVTVEHHYLVKGHTHMEADTIHSCIETKTKNREMYLVEDYIDAIENCRPNTKASTKVKKVNWDFFTDSGLSMVTSLRPGSRKGDPTVAELRALKYGQDGTISYKLKVCDEFRFLPSKIKLPDAFPAPQRLFAGEQTLPPAKKKHLEELKPYIPDEKKDAYSFYYE